MRQSMMKFPIRDPEDYRRLQCLAPDAAIKAYIKGDFTIGEEAALMEVIQRGLRLPLKIDKIEEILMDCMEENVSVEISRQRLLGEA